MDIICFSHLRWDFVYQRPQHLFKRFAGKFRTFFIEEPIFDTDIPFLEKRLTKEGIWLVTPHLSQMNSLVAISQQEQLLLKELLSDLGVTKYIFWYYTPMALSFTVGFSPLLIVYDCMDELSAFKDAPLSLTEKEAFLLQKADLVFTGGYSLYKAKKNIHPAVYPFPSSIDYGHFAEARKSLKDPPDQSSIPHPRIGFFGVIDERMDIGLLSEIAALKPEWHFIMIGPVVKINPATLPAYPNIHYLGPKSYDALPQYLSGWDVAMMPFALNESTKYISPTKTPEYLAGGKPVISTAITDVVNPYGKNNLVYVATDAKDFIAGIETAVRKKEKAQWLRAVDEFLAHNSWDMTVDQMLQLINDAIDKKPVQKLEKENKYV